MKLEIVEPCSANWAAMTPNAQGAFCARCEKNVVDFSSATIEEIKAYFEAQTHAANLCGRFERRQLQRLELEAFVNDFMGWSSLRKAALIVFFVVGLQFFGWAQTAPLPDDGKIMGGIRYVPADTLRAVPDSTHRWQSFQGQVQHSPPKGESAPRPQSGVGEVRAKGREEQ